MKVELVIVVLLFASACKKKEAAPPPPPTPGSASITPDASEPVAAAPGSAAGSGSASATAGAGSGSGSGSAAPALTFEPLAAAQQNATSDLPRAQDVLPIKEQLPAALVVSGDGFRYQVPPDARRTTQDGVTAYVELNEDIVPAVARVFWVTTEKFAGTVHDIANRDHDALLAAGAKNVSSVTNNDGYVAGKPTTSSHLQLGFTAPTRSELRTYAVHDGTAYVMHCATAPDGWALSAHDCALRGTSLHLNPPATKKK
jgi:hypothetical protein